MRNATDADRPEADVGRKPTGAQSAARRRRKGSSRRGSRRSSRRSRSSRSHQSGAGPDGASSIGTLQAAYLDMEDAIWADDLDSDEDIGGEKWEGDDSNTDGDSTFEDCDADGPPTDEDSSNRYTPDRRMRRSPTLLEHLDQDPDDDSASAILDDPPTARGRRQVQQASMER